MPSKTWHLNRENTALTVGYRKDPFTVGGEAVSPGLKRLLCGYLKRRDMVSGKPMKVEEKGV